MHAEPGADSHVRTRIVSARSSSEILMNRLDFLTIWKRLKPLFQKGRTSSGILRGLIREDEVTVGYDRNDVRAKAKKWLLSHGETLTARDILLARDHFGYLLPANWGT